jgi:hypothetical protein
MAPAGSTVLLLNGCPRMPFTNAGTARTITENVTASGKAVMHPGGSPSIRQTGHMSLITPDCAEAVRFGLPPPGVIGGVLMEQAAPDMTYTPVSTPGHLPVDICAALSWGKLRSWFSCGDAIHLKQVPGV